MLPFVLQLLLISLVIRILVICIQCEATLLRIYPVNKRTLLFKHNLKPTLSCNLQLSIKNNSAFMHVMQPPNEHQKQPCVHALKYAAVELREPIR
jgi:hypothetical protein